jgi:glucose-1-phosphatase
MSKGAASVLLFDLGGVLVENHVFDELRSLLGQTVDDDVLRDRWLSSPAVRDFELGRISSTAFTSRFLDEWKISVPPEDFKDSLASWVHQPYPGAEELVSWLRRRHQVSCLTNCNEAHWSQLAPFMRAFDSSFSSHLLGRVKPDKAAFEAVIEALGVRPDQVTFFDDSQTNVESAQRLGITAFRVRGLQEVRRVLAGEGLL